MRCPYCQQNIRVQGRFCPKCGQQIFGLPVRPPEAAPPQNQPPAPQAPAPPPYRPFPQSPPPPDLGEDPFAIEIEPEDRPSAPGPARSGSGAPHAAARDEIGKTCPYCRFPLKPGEQVITCPACHLPHHADCWTENRGCTTYGCQGSAAAAPPSRPPMVPSTLSPTAGTLPSPQSLRLNELMGRANNALIMAILGVLPCCIPLGIFGMFMAMSVLADSKRVPGAGGAHGKAVAATSIGALTIVFWVIWLILRVAGSQ